MFAARLLSLVVFLATPVMAADQSWDGRWVGKLDTDRGQATGFRVVVRFLGNEIKVYLTLPGFDVSLGWSTMLPFFFPRQAPFFHLPWPSRSSLG